MALINNVVRATTPYRSLEPLPSGAPQDPGYRRPADVILPSPDTTCSETVGPVGTYMANRLDTILWVLEVPAHIISLTVLLYNHCMNCISSIELYYHRFTLYVGKEATIRI